MGDALSLSQSQPLTHPWPLREPFRLPLPFVFPEYWIFKPGPRCNCLALVSLTLSQLTKHVSQIFDRSDSSAFRR